MMEQKSEVVSYRKFDTCQWWFTVKICVIILSLVKTSVKIKLVNKGHREIGSLQLIMKGLKLSITSFSCLYLGPTLTFFF